MSLCNFGGRKFLITLGCGIACTLLVAMGKIGDEVFAATVIATVGAYIAGNVTQRVSGDG